VIVIAVKAIKMNNLDNVFTVAGFSYDTGWSILGECRIFDLYWQ
jgi:hypothetical protein